MRFDKSVFAARMRGKRAELDLTQTELAERAGVNITTVCAYESETSVPGADKLFAIADALGVTPNYLLAWDEPAHASPEPVTR